MKTVDIYCLEREDLVDTCGDTANYDMIYIPKHNKLIEKDRHGINRSHKEKQMLSEVKQYFKSGKEIFSLEERGIEYRIYKNLRKLKVNEEEIDNLVEKIELRDKLQGEVKEGIETVFLSYFLSLIENITPEEEKFEERSFKELDIETLTETQYCPECTKDFNKRNSSVGFDGGKLIPRRLVNVPKELYDLKLVAFICKRHKLKYVPDTICEINKNESQLRVY